MGLNLEIISRIFRRPFTQRYPYEKSRPMKRFRGSLAFNPSKCIGCRACERNCPVECIQFYRKGKISFNMGECIYCGTCSEVCPVNAIDFTTEFEKATRDKRKLIVR